MKTKSSSKRKLLLGLKYSLMEGGFSAVLLVVIVINGAFVVGYARKVLNLSEEWIGVHTALPFLVNIVHPLITAVVLQWGRRKEICVGFSVAVAMLSLGS